MEGDLCPCKVPLPPDVDNFPITVHHEVFYFSNTPAVTGLYLLMNETVLFTDLFVHRILWNVCETRSLDYELTFALHQLVGFSFSFLKQIKTKIKPKHLAMFPRTQNAQVPEDPPVAENVPTIAKHL